jgi:hypothetical protein
LSDLIILNPTRKEMISPCQNEKKIIALMHIYFGRGLMQMIGILAVLRKIPKRFQVTSTLNVKEDQTIHCNKDADVVEQRYPQVWACV